MVRNDGICVWEDVQVDIGGQISELERCPARSVRRSPAIMNDLQPDPVFNSRAPSPMDAKLPPPPPQDSNEPLVPPPPSKLQSSPSLPPVQVPQALTLPPFNSLGTGWISESFLALLSS